jgi:ribosomal protein S12 methylthiotransferase accessory factor YcaO
MTTPFDDLERHLMRRMEEFGISRLADTTGLDRTGIDTASVVKPGTADAIWVYSGKGLSKSQARVVAIMECLERTCALWPGDQRGLLLGSAAHVGERHPAEAVWRPERFTESTHPGSTDMTVPWTSGLRLSDGSPVWLPADLVFTGHRPASARGQAPFRVRTSNGLGAAFDHDSAVAHALLEIAERDIVSHHEVIASHAGVSFLAAVAAATGIESQWLGQLYRDDTSHAVTVDPETVPDCSRALIERFSRAGLTVIVKALPNDFGLPAFGVACMEYVTVAHVLGCAGYAARCDPEEALVSALLELAQTRATDLQGAREDRHDIEKQRLPEIPANHWLATPGEVTGFDVAASMFDSPKGLPALKHVLSAFASAGLDDMAVVSFPAPDGIHAIRALVPGVETWHSTGGCSKLGPRLARKINHG